VRGARGDFAIVEAKPVRNKRKPTDVTRADGRPEKGTASGEQVLSGRRSRSGGRRQYLEVSTTSPSLRLARRRSTSPSMLTGSEWTEPSQKTNWQTPVW